MYYDTVLISLRPYHRRWDHANRALQRYTGCSLYLSDVIETTLSATSEIRTHKSMSTQEIIDDIYEYVEITFTEYWMSEVVGYDASTDENKIIGEMWSIAGGVVDALLNALRATISHYIEIGTPLLFYLHDVNVKNFMFILKHAYAEGATGDDILDDVFAYMPEGIMRKLDKYWGAEMEPLHHV